MFRKMLYILYYTNGKIYGEIRHSNYKNYKFWLDVLKTHNFHTETRLELSNIITPDQQNNRGDLLRKVLLGV